MSWTIYNDCFEGTEEQLRAFLKESTYGATIVIHDMVLKDRDTAYDFLREHHNKYKAQAVRFYPLALHERQKIPEIAELQKKQAELLKDLRAYNAEHGVWLRKAAYISCPNCGSKLNRKYFTDRHYNFCFVCNADLRSQTVLDTIEKKNAKIYACNEKIKEVSAKYAEKNPPIWYYEYSVHD